MSGSTIPRRSDVTRRAVARTVVPALGAIGLLVMQVAVTFASDPTPTPPAAGDPRSSGQGPGIVGQPLLAIAAVVAVAVLSVALTLLYVRLTAPRPE